MTTVETSAARIQVRKDWGRDLKTLYHGTAATNAEEISRHGLKPSMRTSRLDPRAKPESHVYLTDDPDRAARWARGGPKDKVAVFKVRVPVEKLSGAGSGEYAHEGPIPPSQIERMRSVLIVETRDWQEWDEAHKVGWKPTGSKVTAGRLKFGDHVFIGGQHRVVASQAIRDKKGHHFITSDPTAAAGTEYVKTQKSHNLSVGRKVLRLDAKSVKAFSSGAGASFNAAHDKKAQNAKAAWDALPEEEKTKQAITAWTTQFRHHTKAGQTPFEDELHKSQIHDLPSEHFDPERAKAQHMLRMMNEKAAPTRGKLHRGVTLTPAQLARLQPGKRLSLDSASWSKTLSTAQDFAAGTSGTKKTGSRTEPVVFIADKGAKGLDLAKYGGGEFAFEKEVVSGGGYKIDSVEKWGKVTQVHVHQTSYAVREEDEDAGSDGINAALRDSHADWEDHLHGTNRSVTGLVIRDWTEWNLEHPWIHRGRHKKWADQDRDVVKKAHQDASHVPAGHVHHQATDMSDPEYREHRDHVEHALIEHGTNDLMRSPFSTHNSEDRVAGVEGAYTPERKALHDQILAEYEEKAKDVPSEHRAVIMGGLGGAGKSTVLRHEAKSPVSVAHKLGIKYDVYDAKGHGVGDPNNFVTINPDDIKERMAELGKIPKVNELSPMEASAFAHEEASMLANRVAERMQARGKNVIHDITLNSVGSGEKRISALRQAGVASPHGLSGYHISGVMVDVSTAQSKASAEARHRGGQDRFDKGIGQGGRYVPSDLILGAKDPQGIWRSKNRAAFETLKSEGRFDHTITIDNEGYANKLVSETGHAKSAVILPSQSQIDRANAHNAAKAAGHLKGTAESLPEIQAFADHQAEMASDVTRSERATTDITDKILSYRRGEMPFQQLVTTLANRTYAQPSAMNIPGQTMADTESRDWSEQGTWGEVQHANDVGLLNNDEYGAIHSAAMEAHGQRSEGDLQFRSWATWDEEHRPFGKGHYTKIGDHEAAEAWARGAHEVYQEHAFSKATTGKSISDKEHRKEARRAASKSFTVSGGTKRERQLRQAFHEGRAHAHHDLANSQHAEMQGIAAMAGAFRVVPGVFDTRSWYEWDIEHPHHGGWHHKLGGYADAFFGKGKHGSAHKPVKTPEQLAAEQKARDEAAALAAAEHARRAVLAGKEGERDLHAEGVWQKRDWASRYGGVMFDPQGRVLLREPLNHFDGINWTFSKGHPDSKDEHPTQAAIRETEEETGLSPRIIGHVPGGFSGSGTGSRNHFYLMEDSGAPFNGSMMNGETQSLAWATPAQADIMIQKGTNAAAVYRDRQTLRAAVAAHEKVTGIHNIQLAPLGPPPEKPKPVFVTSVSKKGTTKAAIKQAKLKPLSPKSTAENDGYQEALQEAVKARLTASQARKQADKAKAAMVGSQGIAQNYHAGRAMAFMDHADMLDAQGGDRADPDHDPSSTMVSLDLPPGTIEPVVGGLPASEHHITIVYAGKTDVGQFAKVIAAAKDVAAKHHPLQGTVGGLDSFPPSEGSDGMTPYFAIPVIPGIEKLREPLEQFNGSEHTDFHPHVTLTYGEEGDKAPKPVPPTPVTFTHLSVHGHGQVVRFPFSGIREELQVRNWTKWKLEHPYIKKGYSHHAPISGHDWGEAGAAAEHAEHPHAPTIMPDAKSLPVPAPKTAPSEGLTALKAAWTDEAREAHAFKPGSTRAQRFEAGYVAARQDAFDKGLSPEDAHELSEQHDIIAKGLQANQAQAKREGVAAGYHAHSVSLGEGPKFTKEPESEFPPNGNPYLKGSPKWKAYESAYAHEMNFAQTQNFSAQEAKTYVAFHEEAAAEVSPSHKTNGVPTKAHHQGAAQAFKDFTPPKLEDVTLNADAGKPVTPPVGHIGVPETEDQLNSMKIALPGETFSNGEKVPNTGSNGGTWYDDGAGNAYFLKGAQSDEHAMNEVAGSLAYQQAGLRAQKVTLVKMNDGHVRALAHYMTGLTPILNAQDTTPETRASARKGYGMDALMSHYDLTGLVTSSGQVDGPNLFKDKNGNVVRLDLGGTGRFRAQGGKKASWKVGSWDHPETTNDYDSIRKGNQGMLAYGPSQAGATVENLPHPGMKASLADAADFDTTKYHQAMLDAGLPESFADEQVKVIESRQAHLKAHVLGEGQADESGYVPGTIEHTNWHDGWNAAMESSAGPETAATSAKMYAESALQPQASESKASYEGLAAGYAAKAGPTIEPGEAAAVSGPKAKTAENLLPGDTFEFNGGQYTVDSTTHNGAGAMIQVYTNGDSTPFTFDPTDTFDVYEPDAKATHKVADEAAADVGTKKPGTDATGKTLAEFSAEGIADRHKGSADYAEGYEAQKDITFDGEDDYNTVLKNLALWYNGGPQAVPKAQWQSKAKLAGRLGATLDVKHGNVDHAPAPKASEKILGPNGNPYPFGSDDEATWQKGFDYAQGYAKQHSFGASQANASAKNIGEAGVDKESNGELTKTEAGVAGLVAGYKAHARKIMGEKQAYDADLAAKVAAAKPEPEYKIAASKLETGDIIEHPVGGLAAKDMPVEVMGTSESPSGATFLTTKQLESNKVGEPGKVEDHIIKQGTLLTKAKAPETFHADGSKMLGNVHPGEQYAGGYMIDSVTPKEGGGITVGITGPHGGNDVDMPGDASINQAIEAHEAALKGGKTEIPVGTTFTHHLGMKWTKKADGWYFKQNDSAAEEKGISPTSEIEEALKNSAESWVEHPPRVSTGKAPAGTKWYKDGVAKPAAHYYEKNADGSIDFKDSNGKVLNHDTAESTEDKLAKLGWKPVSLPSTESPVIATYTKPNFTDTYWAEHADGSFTGHYVSGISTGGQPTTDETTISQIKADWTKHEGAGIPKTGAAGEPSVPTGTSKPAPVTVFGESFTHDEAQKIYDKLKANPMQAIAPAVDAAAPTHGHVYLQGDWEDAFNHDTGSLTSSEVWFHELEKQLGAGAPPERFQESPAPTANIPSEGKGKNFVKNYALNYKLVMNALKGTGGKELKTPAEIQALIDKKQETYDDLLTHPEDFLTASKEDGMIGVIAGGSDALKDFQAGNVDKMLMPDKVSKHNAVTSIKNLVQYPSNNFGGSSGLVATAAKELKPGNKVMAISTKKAADSWYASTPTSDVVGITTNKKDASKVDITTVDKEGVAHQYTVPKTANVQAGPGDGQEPMVPKPSPVETSSASMPSGHQVNVSDLSEGDKIKVNGKIYTITNTYGASGPDADDEEGHFQDMETLGVKYNSTVEKVEEGSSPSPVSGAPTAVTSSASLPPIVPGQTLMAKAQPVKFDSDFDSNGQPFHQHPGYHNDAYDAAYEANKTTENPSNSDLAAADSAQSTAPPGSDEAAAAKGKFNGLQAAQVAWAKAHKSEAKKQQEKEYIEKVEGSYTAKEPFEVKDEGVKPVPNEIPHGTKPDYATEASSVGYDQSIAQGYDQAVAAYLQGHTPEQIQFAVEQYLNKADAVGTNLTNEDEIMEQAHYAGLAQGAGKAAVDLAKSGGDIEQAHPNASSKSILQQGILADKSGHGAYKAAKSGNPFKDNQSATQLSFSSGQKSTVSTWKHNYRYTKGAAYVKALDKIGNGQDPGSGSDAQAAKKLYALYLDKAEPNTQAFQRKVDSSGIDASTLASWEQVGNEISIPLTSWSTDPNAWHGNVWLHAPPGTVSMDIGRIENFDGEVETISGGRFIVKKVEVKGGITHIYLEQTLAEAT